MAHTVKAYISPMASEPRLAWRQGHGTIPHWDLQAQAAREASRILADVESERPHSSIAADGAVIAEWHGPNGAWYRQNFGLFEGRALAESLSAFVAGAGVTA